MELQHKYVYSNRNVNCVLKSSTHKYIYAGHESKQHKYIEQPTNSQSLDNIPVIDHLLYICTLRCSLACLRRKD